VKGRRLKERSGKDADIAHEILAYLADHPHAQDTLEGIVQWWLLEQEILRSTSKVQIALAELISQGLVLEREGRDLRTHYRINRRKSAAIRALLKEREE
jgi:hypothetical protein